MRFDCLCFIFVAALGFLGGARAYASDIFIVAHPDVYLTSRDIRDVFLGNKEFSADKRVVPVDNLAVQAQFTSKVLAMSLDRYNSIWIKKTFRDALNPPPVKANDGEVLEFIRRTKGAVGYLSSAPQGHGIIIVGKF
jgi:hypothetical protein